MSRLPENPQFSTLLWSWKLNWQKYFIFLYMFYLWISSKNASWKHVHFWNSITHCFIIKQLSLYNFSLVNGKDNKVNIKQFPVVVLNIQYKSTSIYSSIKEVLIQPLAWLIHSALQIPKQPCSTLLFLEYVNLYSFLST